MKEGKDLAIVKFAAAPGAYSISHERSLPFTSTVVTFSEVAWVAAGIVSS